MTTETGNIKNSSGIAAGQGNQAQVVTVNLPPPVPPPPEWANDHERIRFLTAAMMQLQGYFVSDRAAHDAAYAADTNERQMRQADHDDQHDRLNERMLSLEVALRESAERRDRRMDQIADLARLAAEEARATATQAREFQFVIGAAVIAIMVAMFVLVWVLGRMQGWW